MGNGDCGCAGVFAGQLYQSVALALYGDYAGEEGSEDFAGGECEGVAAEGRRAYVAPPGLLRDDRCQALPTERL